MRRITILLVLALLSACSSTSKPTRIAGPSETAEASVLPDAAEGSAGEAAASAAGPSGSARRATASTGKGAPKAGTAPGGVTGAAPGPVLQPGGPVLVGVHYSENLDAAYTALGAQRTSVDFHAVANAIKDHINKNGGMGGRELKIELHGSDPLRGDFDVLAQTMCEHFTQDAKVFAVVSGAVLPSYITPKCLSERKTPLAWEYYIPMDEQLYSPWLPYLYQPFSVLGKRMGHTMDGLKEIGFFDPGAKIGLMRYDIDVHKRISDNVYKPRLAAHGLSITDEQAVRRPPNAGSAGDTAAQISNAVLSFKRNLITHVIFVPSGGAIPFVMHPIARSQDFYPRYGFDSLDYPFFVAGQTGRDSLARAVAVGWMPANDVAPAHGPADHPSEECFKITNTRVNDVARYCDGLFFLKAIFDKAPVATQADVQKVAESLGEGFRSHWTFRSKLAPGRHDGATHWRPLAFDTGCGCWRYADASLRPLP